MSRGDERRHEELGNPNTGPREFLRTNREPKRAEDELIQRAIETAEERHETDEFTEVVYPPNIKLCQARDEWIEYQLTLPVQLRSIRGPRVGDEWLGRTVTADKEDPRLDTGPVGECGRDHSSPTVPEVPHRSARVISHAGDAFATETGKKYDEGKPQLSLVPSALIHSCARAMEYGLAKYNERDSWKDVPELRRRYTEALLRHIEAIREHGIEAIDPESGLLHLDHVSANVAFLSWALDVGVA